MGIWSNNRLVIASLGAALLAWVVESLVVVWFISGDDFSTAILPRNGHELWMRIIVAVTIVGFGIYGQRVVNGRARAEAQARTDHQRLELVLGSVAEAIFTTDAQLRVLGMNPKATSLVGLELAAAEGRPLDVVLPLTVGEGDEARVWSLSEALRGGEEVRLPEGCRIARGGEARFVAGMGAPLAASGAGNQGWVLSVRDVTREMIERVGLLDRQRFESIGQLAGAIAHELSSPLTGILNFGELLRMDLAAGTESLQFADGVVDEAKRMSNILRSLVAYARDDATGRSLVEVRALVEPVVVLMNALYRKDQIAVQIDLPDALPRVSCHRQALQQVLMNVLTNARDALNARFSGHDARKQVIIRGAVLVDDGGRWVRVTVEDHGAGLSRDAIEQVFAPFFTTKLGSRHSGLGLTVSRMILDDHGGRLTVEPVGEHCTRVHFDLPEPLEGEVANGALSR